MDKQITEAIQQVRRRLFMITFRQHLFTGLCIGLGLGLLVLLVSRWFLLPHARFIAVLLIVLGGTGGFVSAWVRRPITRDAVRLMDQRGLEDRMSTALTYWDSKSEAALFVKAEAAQQSVSFLRELSKKVPYPRWSYRAWGNMLLAAMFIFLLLWPNPLDEVLARKHLESEWIEQQEEMIEEWLDKQDESEWLNVVDELISLLGDTELADEALQYFEEALRDLQQQAERMEQQLDQGEQLLEEWNDALEHGVSPEALRESFTQSNDPLERELAEAIGEELDDPLSEVKEALNDMQEERERLREISQQLASSGLAMAEELAEQERNTSPFWGREGTAEDMMSEENDNGSDDPADSEIGEIGENDAEGQGESSGVNEGAGSGDGDGTGESSGGDGGAGSGEGGEQGAGQGTGTGSAGRGSAPLDYLTVPDHLDGESTTEVDTGPLQGEIDESELGGRAPAAEGESKSYDQVYREYEREASQTIDRGTLPQHMKQLVRDYFLEIQPDTSSDRGRD